MLDIKFIRENKDLIVQGAKKKHLDFDVEKLIAIDDKRRALLVEVETMRAKQNEASVMVGKTSDQAARESLIAEMKTLKETLQKKEEALKEVMVLWQAEMVAVPNIPDMSVPEGATDKDNKEISKWGKIPTFSFTPKSHVELMQTLNMIDLERGVKVAGFRGYILKNAGAMLNFAIWRFVLDRLSEKGYEPMIVPSLVSRSTLLGTGYLPQGEEDLYKTQDSQYLAGTGEVGVMGSFIDDTFEGSALPKKIVGFSPCFRREAGSHGRDTKGLMRVHEFYKL
jgi:seryl-tRNA synthetase